MKEKNITAVSFMLLLLYRCESEIWFGLFRMRNRVVRSRLRFSVVGFSSAVVGPASARSLLASLLQLLATRARIFAPHRPREYAFRDALPL